MGGFVIDLLQQLLQTIELKVASCTKSLSPMRFHGGALPFQNNRNRWQDLTLESSAKNIAKYDVSWIRLDILVGGSRGLKKANRNIVRQITKFGMIVFCKIIINI